MLINNSFFKKKFLIVGTISAILGAYFFINKKDKTLGDVFLFVSLVQFLLYFISNFLKKEIK